MIQAVLLWITLTGKLVLHPFHISVCELVYAEDSNSLEISCRIFMDDMELTLTRRTEVQNYFETRGHSHINQDIEKYLRENLTLMLDNKPVLPDFVGYEIEEEVVWCYLEVKEVTHIEDLTVNYQVLHETFDDQINLAHIKYLDNIKSLRFSKGSEATTVVF